MPFFSFCSLCSQNSILGHYLSLNLGHVRTQSKVELYRFLLFIRILWKFEKMAKKVSANTSGAHFWNERERERRSEQKKWARTRAALNFSSVSASASGARKVSERSNTLTYTLLSYWKLNWRKLKIVKKISLKRDSDERRDLLTTRFSHLSSRVQKKAYKNNSSWYRLINCEKTKRESISSPKNANFFALTMKYFLSCKKWKLWLFFRIHDAEVCTFCIVFCLTLFFGKSISH